MANVHQVDEIRFRTWRHLAVLIKLVQISKKFTITWKNISRVSYYIKFSLYLFWGEYLCTSDFILCKSNNTSLSLKYSSSFFIRTTHLPQLQVQQEVQVELEKKKTPKEKYSKRELTYTRYVLMITFNKYSQLIFLIWVSGDTIQVITVFRKHGTNSHFIMAWLFWDKPFWRCEVSDICKVGS